jgi:ABC-type phosphate transport system substrate-binding protein
MKLSMKFVSGGVALAATAALVSAAVVPANADPTRPFAATGSDTTESVWNGLTNDGGPFASIASYNAFDGVNAADSPQSVILTKTTGKWFKRPAGSGNGVKALSAVWDPSNHSWGGVNLGPGEEIDFARSSSGPSGTGSDLTYIPFARDAVSIVYKGAALGALNLTTNQIIELYTGVDDAGDSTVTFSGGLPLIDGTSVTPNIPQSGSGTRNFFLGAIGNPTLASYVDDTANPENDGTVLESDGDLIPFSAANWIAQKNNVPGAANTVAGLSIATINGQAPTTGTAPNLTPGALYGPTVAGNHTTPPSSGTGVFNRDTYNVVPSTFISAGTTKQANLVGILTSGMGPATVKAIIKKYGFGTLSYNGTSSQFKLSPWRH